LLNKKNDDSNLEV